MKKLKIMYLGAIAMLLVNGCALPPAPGNNETYRQIQMQEIPLPKAKKQPRFITKKSLLKLKSSGDEK